MKCPLCGNEMRIAEAVVEVTGDDSPEQETRVFQVLRLQCRSRQCPRWGKDGEEVRELIYGPKTAEE